MFKPLFRALIFSIVLQSPGVCRDNYLGESQCHCSYRQEEITSSLQPVFLEITDYFQKDDQYAHIEKRLKKAKKGTTVKFAFWIKKTRGGVISSISEDSSKLQIEPYIRTLVTNLPPLTIPPKISSLKTGVCVQVELKVIDGKVSSMIGLERVVLTKV